MGWLIVPGLFRVPCWTLQETHVAGPTLLAPASSKTRVCKLIMFFGRLQCDTAMVACADRPPHHAQQEGGAPCGVWCKPHPHAFTENISCGTQNEINRVTVKRSSAQVEGLMPHSRMRFNKSAPMRFIRSCHSRCLLQALHRKSQLCPPFNTFKSLSSKLCRSSVYGPISVPYNSALKVIAIPVVPIGPPQLNSRVPVPWHPAPFLESLEEKHWIKG